MRNRLAQQTAAGKVRSCAQLRGRVSGRPIHGWKRSRGFRKPPLVIRLRSSTRECKRTEQQATKGERRHRISPAAHGGILASRATWGGYQRIRRCIQFFYRRNDPADLPAAAFAEDIDDMPQPLAPILPVHLQRVFHAVRVSGGQSVDNFVVLVDHAAPEMAAWKG